MDAKYWINHLQLVPHPEGGYYRETYRSSDIIAIKSLPSSNNSRNISTAIYFLLPSGKISAFHRIHSDELWFFHHGTSLLIHCLDRKTGLKTHRLGLNLERGDLPQVVIHAGSWFGAQVEEPQSYSLVSCTVAPGFDFQDFEMAKREELIKEYPEHKELITKLSY